MSVLRFSIAGGLLILAGLAHAQTEYKAPAASQQVDLGKAEPFCPEGRAEWRKKQVIEGVTIEESPVCNPDNPYEVAAFVKGTNNVSMETLMHTDLAPDAVVMGKDLDGDGDPDEVHIRLEIMELNGRSPDMPDTVPGYAIAPGIQPGLWVFTPKTRGMSTKSFIDIQANPLLRLPAPVIRVEQGDKVKITLENTHYLPHSIHLHGVDHPFYLDHPMPMGYEGNDGVPETSEFLVMPGESKTYEFTPRQAGTMFYHCHVQANVHIAMGLAGIFVVEENRPNNWVQTFNVGAGHVRHPSVAVLEHYNREYDLQYMDSDREMHNLIQTSNDARVIAKAMHQTYDMTDATADYFTLNGHSFPYTLRDSLIVVGPNENVKLRVLNSGEDSLALHTHGHTFTITHYDGIEHNPAAQITRDTVMVGSAQRVDLRLNTVDDGLHSSGPGIWMFHAHNEKAVTTDGMYPGGNINLIVYQSFLGENGLPMAHGEDLKPYFTKAFYEKKVPVWITSDKEGWFGEVAEEPASADSSSASVGVSSPKLFIGLTLLAAFVAVLVGLPRVKLKRL
jgi:FtsP/CotA-like multicopper oxidase with cupredoxin domain